MIRIGRKRLFALLLILLFFPVGLAIADCPNPAGKPERLFTILISVFPSFAMARTGWPLAR